MVGGKVAATLEQSFGFVTARDLLRHYPRRYAKRGELTDIASLRVGEEVTIVARVRSAHIQDFRSRPGARFEAVLEDGSGAELTLTFFAKQRRQLEWRMGTFRPGTVALFAGTVSLYQGRRQLAHPESVPLDKTGGRTAEEFAQELIPIYPATKDVRSWQVANVIGLALKSLDAAARPDAVGATGRARPDGPRHGVAGHPRAGNLGAGRGRPQATEVG